MAIFARIEHPEPDWWMVDPIEAELGNKATFASGVEITVEIRHLSGVVVPESRIRILGYRDKQGGKINGQEIIAHRIEKRQLGVAVVEFYPEVPNEGFGNDQQELENYDQEKVAEKGEYFVNEINARLRRRRDVKENSYGSVSREETAAGKLLLEGMDDYGLLKVIVERVDNKRK